MHNSPSKSDPTQPSPYDPALRRFSDVRAEAKIAARNWQIFAWFCLLIAIGGLGLAFMHDREPREVPYVVSYNAQNGQITNLGLAEPLSQDQRAAIIVAQYTLRQFVQNWRMVVPATDFQNKMINDYVKPFLGNDTPASALVAAFYKAANPFTLAQQETVDVSVDEPVPETPTTYELNWTETAKNLDGVVLQTTVWRGFATIEYQQPSQESVRLNPAGVTITNLTVQEVNTPISTTPTPTP